MELFHFSRRGMYKLDSLFFGVTLVGLGLAVSDTNVPFFHKTLL